MNSRAIIFLINLFLFIAQFEVVKCDTWITLWNKLNVPVEVHCLREGAKKFRSFKKKLLEPDDRYDIKGFVIALCLAQY